MHGTAKAWHGEPTTRLSGTPNHHHNTTSGRVCVVAAAALLQGLFDAWVENTSDVAASFSRLAEVVHQHYPEVVVPHFVYGYGRALWDPAVRQYGRHTLHVMVLGPVASGKSTQCELLAQRFALPHINVGDLLYEEIAKKTPLGLEAKEYTDASKTVPDRCAVLLCTLVLLTLRLRPACPARRRPSRHVT